MQQPLGFISPRHLQAEMSFLWSTSEFTSMVPLHWCCMPKPRTYTKSNWSKSPSYTKPRWQSPTDLLRRRPLSRWKSSTTNSWSCCRTNRVLHRNQSRFNLQIHMCSFCTHFKSIIIASSSILAEFSNYDYRPTFISLNEDIQLRRNIEIPSINATLYKQLVGKLLYLTCTSINIAYATNLASRYMH